MAESCSLHSHLNGVCPIWLCKMVISKNNCISPPNLLCEKDFCLSFSGRAFILYSKVGSLDSMNHYLAPLHRTFYLKRPFQKLALLAALKVKRDTRFFIFGFMWTAARGLQQDWSDVHKNHEGSSSEDHEYPTPFPKPRKCISQMPKTT